MAEKKITWTDEQLSAINTTECAGVVSAAAGSGKTAVLIERTIRLLSDEKKRIPADKLLAVTFTNDATSQMKEKLNAAFSERIEKEPDNEWLASQQSKLQAAHITTINSFCLDMVKSKIHEFDFQNGLRILDDSESSIIEMKAMDLAMEKSYSEEKETMDLLYSAFCKKSDREIEELVISLYKFKRSLPFGDTWLKKMSEMLANEEYINKCRETVINEALERINTAYVFSYEALKYANRLQYHSGFNNIISNDHNSIVKAKEIISNKNLTDILDFFNSFKFEAWRAATTKAEKEALKDSSVFEFENATLDVVKNYREIYKDAFSKTKELFTCREEDVESDFLKSKKLFDGLCTVLKRFEDEVMSLKLEKNAVDFADVELMTVKLLWEETENGLRKTKFANELVDSEAYKVILIDEYQDVNNLQDMIFKGISKDGREDLIGKNMFVVGDVKQSIYRFRQANPKIFIKTRESVKDKRNLGDISEVLLKRNFRSRKNVVDFVNFVFTPLMNERIGEIKYNDDEKLVQGASFDGDDIAADVILISGKNEELAKKLDCKQEHIAVAMKIKSMIDNKVEVFDHGVMRPCRSGDFCVLTRKKSGIKMFKKAFEYVGLSISSEEIGGYLKSREISLAINMLSVIDNPLNDVPLASVLLSPFFMFTDNDLAKLKTTYNCNKLYQYLLRGAEGEEIDEALSKKCNDTVELIKKMRFFASGLSISKLIRKIYNMTDFFSSSSAYDDGAQKKANLLLLVEYANVFESGTGGGLSDFVRYIKHLEENSKDFNQASTVVENSKAVVLKTIHKSKGLEYPFVFLAETSGEFNMDDFNGNMLINNEFGIGFKFLEKTKLMKCKTLAFSAVSIVAMNEFLSEELRLLYVALTRAKEGIFLTLDLNASKTFKVVDEINFMNGVREELVSSARCMQDWILMSILLYKKREKFFELLMDQYMKEEELDSETVDVSRFYQSFDNLPVFDFDVKIDFENELEAKSVKEENENNLALEEPDLKTVNELSHYLDFNYESRELGVVSKYTVSEIAKKDEPEEIFFPQTKKFNEQIGELTAAEKGTAAHLFMENADYKKASENLESEISRLVETGLLTEKQGISIDRNSLNNFFKGEFYKRMEKSPQIFRERQFLVLISDLKLDDEMFESYNGTDSMLQGIADCIFEEDDGYVLVDYKTDRVKTKEELFERYALQLKLYKAAFDLILDKPVKSSYIYSFALKEGFELDLKNV